MLLLLPDKEAGSGSLARMSLRGRNFAGVWYTFGADEGGLKVMWVPCVGGGGGCCCCWMRELCEGREEDGGEGRTSRERAEEPVGAWAPTDVNSGAGGMLSSLR